MANIFIYDEFNPEDIAMMQALYSRSPKSVVEHVDRVKKSGSGKFMETFYVGYGHASIADCGSTTIFIENISILADKAIQDWPLYSGQETSTRYIDMSKQEIKDPLNNNSSKEIINNWMDFYVNSEEELEEFLTQKYPRQEDEDEKMYLKAIKARSFDIRRGFLPAGISTQLSWHTNLRQAWDKLSLLLHHPLPEVQEIAQKILKELQGKYSHSFSHKLYPEQEKYRQVISDKYTYFALASQKELSLETTLESKMLSPYQDIIDSRPIKTNLPLFMNDLGLMKFKFNLDFGSFRDIQRHRNGVTKMPLLTTKLNFNDWYLEQLPEKLHQEATSLISKQTRLINKLKEEDKIKQYYIAMGFNVSCSVSYPLGAAIYVMELRSGKTVHPSLRHIAHAMAKKTKIYLPNLKMHIDYDLDDWDIRRGSHDISEK